MLAFNHAMVGLIVGYFTGHMYLGFFLSLIIDLDHLFGYFKKDMLKFNKKFFKDLLKDQGLDLRKTLVHTIWGLLVTSTIIYFIFDITIFLTWFICYALHLVMDSLDSAPVTLLYPIKTKFLKFNKGLFKYNSLTEYIVLISLFTVYITILYIKP